MKVINNFNDHQVPPVNIGDVYKLTQPAHYEDGVLPIGTKIFVLGLTKKLDSGERVSASGNNYYCSTNKYVGLWSTLEQYISAGFAKKEHS